MQIICMISKQMPLVVEFGILWRFPSAKIQSQISRNLTKIPESCPFTFGKIKLQKIVTIFGDFQLLWKAITRLHIIPKLPSSGST